MPDHKCCECVKRLRDRVERYDELILAVSMKWPGETRHQTALRHIQRAEAQDSSVAAAKFSKPEDV